MEGQGNKDKWHMFCKETKIPRIFLLDADVVATAQTNEESQNICAQTHALTIHNNIIKMLTDNAIENNYATRIADLLRKTFLQQNPSIDQCKKFTDQEKKENLDIIRNKYEENHEQENVEMERLFGIIDARLYGKVYTDEIEKWMIPQPSECQWTRNEMFLRRSKIVSDKVKKTFQEHLETDTWIQARDALKDENLFVWKDGSLEDVVLGIIFATKTENPVERTDEIFRKYLSFFSLKIDLSLERFHKKRSKKEKLYYEKSSISNEDIESSIDRVFKFCLEDFDVVHFLYFLTMQAK